MKRISLAAVGIACLLTVAPGCRDRGPQVVAPPAQQESVVPLEGMSEDEYAKAMAEVN
ncbi:hypothetical protein [Roseiconus nitratireducens]|uniref:hypothetical protein n=1 Tax=Roseiconus nitratireducens TaxID=2605748 RepID=UPI001375C769|nr:hypothetical protein [Roseiconus nitratireducens]